MFKIINYLYIAIVIPPAIGQFIADLGMKPDVTFGEDNERFDIGPFMETERNHYREKHNFKDYDEDLRRHNMVRQKFEDYEDYLRRYNKQKDDKDDEPVVYVLDRVGRNARKSLMNILSRIRGIPRTRKYDLDPESEALMNYAFPVNVKIEGYLQAPLNE